MVEMMREAEKFLEDEAFYGLVIGNDGRDFSVGANLHMVWKEALEGNGKALEEACGELQQALLTLRYSTKPVVAAVHGRVLGGGVEIALAADRIVAHSESYFGLVEAGAGLVPAAGGLKELIRRVISPAMADVGVDPLPLAQKLLETVAMAKVSSSAAEARELGFLGQRDRVVMLREHLLYEAKQELLAIAAEGYLPPPPEKLYAGGRDLYAALRLAVWSLQQAGYASEHDARVAERVAFILSGGDLSAPQWVDEEYFLELERRSFAELATTEKTQERIRHLLETGKPLRN
jgi:3-hydroxyacyl-CoA dehydrogenase